MITLVINNFTFDHVQILKYSKVLTLAQEGDKDKTQAAIQECFPDINTPINKVI